MGNGGGCGSIAGASQCAPTWSPAIRLTEDVGWVCRGASQCALTRTRAAAVPHPASDHLARDDGGGIAALDARTRPWGTAVVAGRSRAHRNAPLHGPRRCERAWYVGRGVGAHCYAPSHERGPRQSPTQQLRHRPRLADPHPLRAARGDAGGVAAWDARKCPWGKAVIAGRSRAHRNAPSHERGPRPTWACRVPPGPRTSRP
jgi:hypothetical protein